jgi:hypothetical protein
MIAFISLPFLANSEILRAIKFDRVGISEITLIDEPESSIGLAISSSILSRIVD